MVRFGATICVPLAFDSTEQDSSGSFAAGSGRSGGRHTLVEVKRSHALLALLSSATRLPHTRGAYSKISVVSGASASVGAQPFMAPSPLLCERKFRLALSVLDHRQLAQRVQRSLRLIEFNCEREPRFCER